VAETIYRLQRSRTLSAAALGGEPASLQTLASDYFPK
jgi:hypothetical protein